MEYIDLLEIIPQVFTFIGSQDPEAQADQGPEVHHRVSATVMLAQFVDLGMAVVAGGNTIVCTGGLDLLVFEAAVFQTLLLEAGLEKPAAPAAAEVVGTVGGHVDEIFFTDDRFDYKAQIIGNRIAIAFADDLAGILDRELDLEVLVPVGIDLEFAFADPFGVVFVNAFDDEIVFDVEFFQSCQD